MMHVNLTYEACQTTRAYKRSAPPITRDSLHRARTQLKFKLLE